MIKARVEIALCSSYTSTIDAVRNYMEYTPQWKVVHYRNERQQCYRIWRVDSSRESELISQFIPGWPSGEQTLPNLMAISLSWSAMSEKQSRGTTVWKILVSASFQGLTAQALEEEAARARAHFCPIPRCAQWQSRSAAALWRLSAVIYNRCSRAIPWVLHFSPCDKQDIKIGICPSATHSKSVLFTGVHD